MNFQLHDENKFAELIFVSLHALCEDVSTPAGAVDESPELPGKDELELLPVSSSGSSGSSSVSSGESSSFREVISPSLLVRPD